MCKFFPTMLPKKLWHKKSESCWSELREDIYGIHTNTSESVTDGLTGVQGARDAYAIRI